MPDSSLDGRQIKTVSGELEQQEALARKAPCSEGSEGQVVCVELVVRLR